MCYLENFPHGLRPAGAQKREKVTRIAQVKMILTATHVQEAEAIESDIGRDCLTKGLGTNR